jgi:hypothetical protein
MKPDAEKYNPDPSYLRELIAKSGLSQRETARRIGISERYLRQLLASPDKKTALVAPYPIQYCIEQLAR